MAPSGLDKKEIKASSSLIPKLLPCSNFFSFFLSQQISVEYRDIPPQVFISKVNKFFRENQPPGAFSAKVFWQRVIPEEDREQIEQSSNRYETHLKNQLHVPL